MTSAAVDESYRLAARVTRRSGSNFWWSFALLPPEKRRAMKALYAFARVSDDLGDGGETSDERSEALSVWREATRVALSLGTAPAATERCGSSVAALPAHAWDLLPAVLDASERFAIPREHLLGIIDGVLTDQMRNRFASFEELDQYCYLVASTVGLCCVHIWGYEEPFPSAAAIDCGIGFQMTNILRDLREDAARDRIYVPAECWRPLGLSEQDILQCHWSAAGTGTSSPERTRALKELVARLAERAVTHYRRGWKVYDALHPDGRPMFSMMWRTYRALLARIERSPEEVFRRRIHLGPIEQARIVGSHFVGPIFRRLPPPSLSHGSDS